MSATTALSAAYAAQQFRATRLDQPTYRAVSAGDACAECYARQHETAGAAGKREPARYRREFRATSDQAEHALLLCRPHAELWRERDTADTRASVRGVPA